MRPPPRGQLVAGVGPQRVRQVDRRADVVRYDAHAAAQGRRAGLTGETVDHRVVLREQHDTSVGEVEESPVPRVVRRPVRCECLATGVQDHSPARVAHDGRLAGDRQHPGLRGAELPLLGVVQGVDARSQLGGDARRQARLEGGRRPSAQHPRLDVARPQRVGRHAQRRGLVARRRVATVGCVPVAREREDAAHVQPRGPRHGGDVAGPDRWDAGTVLTAVDLDEHGEPGDQGTQAGRRRRAVDPDGHGGPLRQGPEPVGAVVVEPDRVGDEHVGAPVLDEHLRLAERRHGEPDRPELELAPSDLRALVGLRVGTQSDAGVGRGRGGPGEVGLETADVDLQEGGRRRLHHEGQPSCARAGPPVPPPAPRPRR